MMELPSEAWLENEFFQQENLEYFLEQVKSQKDDILPDHLKHIDFNWTAMRQVDIQGIGRADVVFVIPDKNALSAVGLIIELKKQADEGAIAQALRYCGALDSLTTDCNIWAIPIVGAFSFSFGAVCAAIGGRVHLLKMGLNKLNLIPYSHLPGHSEFQDVERYVTCPRLSEHLNPILDAFAEELAIEHNARVALPFPGAE